MTVNIEDLKDLLRKRLSEKRYYHSLCVADEAKRLSFIYGADAEKMCELEVELNQRIALALSPIAFLLLGLPLAIHTSRRETSVGLFLSVILGGVFFLAIIVFESLTSFPKLYPQYLIWLPNLVFQALGATMLYRVSQR